MITITPIPAFTDNYIWLIAEANNAWVVDPGDAQPVLRYLKEKNLNLAGIVATHHHFDHTGGIDQLLRQYPVPVYGNSEQIPQVTRALQEGDRVRLGSSELQVLAVPGHTLDHIAYFGSIAGHGDCLFCGDTLFSAGCGRVFEGTAEIMLNSLNKLASLPSQTKIFCAHEYTLANLKFASAVLPTSAEVQQRTEVCQQTRARHQPTLPAMLAGELTYNPFLMAGNAQVIDAAAKQLGRKPVDQIEVFATIRRWKDNF